ncbi:MAG: hypothetical protein HY822_05280 [Acidobacteria bacterium]|nr:hypothetical protein [Acidobacteriota bacterium]
MKRLIPAVLLLPSLWADNAVRPGPFVVEPSTLICLGFEWEIAGDDNRNATVEVQYRPAGRGEWKPALPLLRMGGERVYRDAEFLDYTVPHRFAGSILDLEPGTEYDCRLTMKDPDGVRGQAVQTVKVRTRSAPKAAEGGRVLHVYPPDWKGPKQEPAFTGLKAAYYGPGRGDWSVLSERKARPGDVILVHAGLYKADRLNYVDPLGTPFDGAYILTLKGAPEKPIVIRAAGDGEPIFDGNGCFRLFDVMAAEHHIFEGLTIRNTDIAFYAGLKDVLGAKGLTVRNCRIEDVGIAVTTEYAGSKDFYIADNVILGRDDRYRLNGWASPGIYGATQLKSYIGIKVYGSGHVICHNAVAYFHDGICVSTYGTPEPEQDRKAVAIDIYNNDIHLMADDFIEADGGVHNIRVMRNRGVNAAQCGLSAQPVFGGPAYFIRNVLYHGPNGTALKFMAKPAGLIVYHNTIISEDRNRDPYSNAHFRNNLFLGTDAPNRNIVVFPNATPYSTYDYDGFRPNRGVSDQYLWMMPPETRPRGFKSLQELNAATGQEAHGVELDYDIFENLRAPDPTQPRAIYHAEDLDFRLRAGSKAADAGVPLPNVNDDFTGQAPDLGALETGKPVPVYGPRGSQRQAFYR